VDSLFVESIYLLVDQMDGTDLKRKRPPTPLRRKESVMTNKLRDEKPTPEEKCEHIKTPYGFLKCQNLKCEGCFPVSSPSPEARVDWEAEAWRLSCGHDWMVPAIAKALSAAFEKGREAR